MGRFVNSTISFSNPHPNSANAQMYYCLFSEALPLCAARVDSLRSHGHQEAALRLAVAVVRTMKQQQLNAQRKWHDSQLAQLAAASTSKSNPSNQQCSSKCQGGPCSSASTSSATASTSASTSTASTSAAASTSTGTTYTAAVPPVTDGWVGHPLDPIGCLFDTLAEASIVPDDQIPRASSYFGK